MASSVSRYSTLIAAVAVLAVLAPLANAGTRETVLPTIYVEYTMNCTFTISDDYGRRVTSLAPGTYQIHITSPVVFSTVDLSGINDMTACKGFLDFRLTGPGVNLTTTLQDGDEDKDTFKETFQPSGSYTAVDLNQPAVARAVFTTTASGSPDAPQSPYKPSTSSSKGDVSQDPIGSAVKTNPLRGTLTAIVSSTGKVQLLFKGKPVSTLKEGRYTATVKDQSKKAGLLLQLLGKSGQVVSSLTASSTPFVGRRTAELTLKKGQWGFLPTSSGKKSYFIVVG
jgi:hypothetical protein